MSHRATTCGLFCALWEHLKRWCVPDFKLTFDSIDQDWPFPCETGDECQYYECFVYGCHAPHARR
jgi:hypothetical protein